LDEVIRIWLQKLKLNKYFKKLIFNTLLFADDQLIVADTEDNFQKTKMDIRELDCEVLMLSESTQDRNQVRCLLSAVLNLRALVPQVYLGYLFQVWRLSGDVTLES
jgi:beta-xylosidase